MNYPLPRDFRVQFEDLRVVARGLNRPECVLALSNGELLAAHGNGGYSHVTANGDSVVHVLDWGDTRDRRWCGYFQYGGRRSSAEDGNERRDHGHGEHGRGHCDVARQRLVAATDSCVRVDVLRAR